MVTNSRTTPRSDHLRALNEPVLIRVMADGPTPRAIIEQASQDLVEEVLDMWIVQDEWWRQEIDRQYFAVLLQSGRLRTIYHDRVTNAWYEQAY